MGINPADFRQLIVRPTLQKLGKWSPSLENLLIGTAAQASRLGLQTNNASGLGIFQISAELHQTVWDRFLAFDADLASAVRGLASQREFLCNPHAELVTNLSYATAIAWAVYASHEADIPTDSNNIESLARCWQQSYCSDASQSVRSFVTTYQQLVQQENAKAA